MSRPQATFARPRLPGTVGEVCGRTTSTTPRDRLARLLARDGPGSADELAGMGGVGVRRGTSASGRTAVKPGMTELPGTCSGARRRRCGRSSGALARLSKPLT
jgi:hypothetical protein